MTAEELRQCYYRSLISDNAAGTEFRWALEHVGIEELERAAAYLEGNPVGNKARRSRVLGRLHKLKRKITK